MEEEPKGSHRTRSKAAPYWTTEESSILVNEIAAIESDWGDALPSFQKWQQIVENCNALGVNRDLNQCRRRWNALLSGYSRAKLHGAAVNEAFTAEIFEAVDRFINASGTKNSGGGMATEAVGDDGKEEQQVRGIDPESDPETFRRVTQFCSEAGSSKQRCRSRKRRPKRRSQKLNPWGYFTSPTMDHEEPSSEKETVMKNSKYIVGKSPLEESNADMQEQIMAGILRENASQIIATIEGKLVDDVDCKLTDLKNTETAKMDHTRRQGDKLINCLGKINNTLNQLCDLVQHCN